MSTTVSSALASATTPAPSATVEPADRLDPTDALAYAPTQALDRIERGIGLGRLARRWVWTILVCAGAFGVTLGLFRGGVQALFAGIKLPLVVLLSAAVLAPALTCLNGALGRPADLRRDLGLVLACLARATLVLAAEMPLLWLGLTLEADYHTLVLGAVGTCAVAGAAALVMLIRGLWRVRQGAIITAFLLVSGFMVVGAQMTWVFRPYLVRPRDADPPFLRPLDGDFIESVATTAHSARGVYAPTGREQP